MTNFFFRIYLVLFALVSQCMMAQNQDFGLSDATLEVNSSDIPVKLFATSDLAELYSFAADKSNPNVFVILNKSNIATESFDSSAMVLTRFKDSGYQFLDKNYKLIDAPLSVENVDSYKYAVKNSKPIIAADQVSLDAPFKIWDPSVGLNLGFFTLHYYSLMFVFAFGIGFFLMTKMYAIDKVNEKYVEPFFTWTLIGTILGARMGHVIFYQPELFKEDFWSVFLPISTKGGLKFTGFQGLASHGATIMVIATTLWYSFKIIKKNPLWVFDRLGIVVAIGGAFVRMGNFFNSEIIGKPVDPNSPFALFFPQQSSEYGITIPRYPTQLFEAMGYFCLFLLLWVLYNKTNKKYQQGWLFGLFFIILWAIRFFVEFLKEPQGLEKIHLGSLNTGQVLSIPFIIAGIIIMVISKKYKITEAENGKPE